MYVPKRIRAHCSTVRVIWIRITLYSTQNVFLSSAKAQGIDVNTARMSHSCHISFVYNLERRNVSNVYRAAIAEGLTWPLSLGDMPAQSLSTRRQRRSKGDKSKTSKQTNKENRKQTNTHKPKTKQQISTQETKLTKQNDGKHARK